jgi:EpsI family protein
MNAIAPSGLPSGIPFWRTAVVLALVGLAAAACFWGSPTVGLSESGVNMHLPEKVGGYTGKELPVSESEIAILPSDTEFAKKLYSDGRGEEIQCQIVLAGAEKRSLHRPEVCLTGQGWTLKSGEVVTIPLANGKSLDVMKLFIGRPIRLPNGEQKEITSIYLYWFVGKNSTTPYHFVRILKTNLDMLLHNVNHRWAYIIVSTPVLEGFSPNGRTAGETDKALREFIAQLAPTIMSPR